MMFAASYSTYGRWREQYKPGEVDNEGRCRELDSGNMRLKKLVADLLYRTRKCCGTLQKRGKP
jgi:hypothetical protein